MAAETQAELMREEATKARYQAEAYRRDAVLLNTRAEELERVRWDLELAADRFDEAHKVKDQRGADG